MWPEKIPGFLLLSRSASIPTGEDVLCKFVTKMASEGLKHRTIKTYMAGVRHLHIKEGLGDPFLPSLRKLHYVLRGVKRAQGEAGTSGRECLPITPGLLRKIKSVWDKDSSNSDIVMLWAGCCLVFFCLMRAGELTVPRDSGFDASAHLAWGDLAVNDPGQPNVLSVRIKASKTDPFRKGITLFVGKISSGLCPVYAMLAYLVIRGPQPGPLFMFNNGHYLTRARFCGC